LRLAKWGSEVGLQGSNPEPLMSALGQKQTLAHVRIMSALPPKADIGCRATRQTTAKHRWFDSVFLRWDFVRKNQAEPKSSFAEGAQGRHQMKMQFQMFSVSHSTQTFR
jgi:hypothetical protein